MIAAILAGTCVGVAAGVGGYTFVYAKGASYMSDAPTVCANCHIMQSHLDGWYKSSHRNVAVCNDCHTPHTFLAKYYVKALNGYHHSLAFTTGNFHEPIQIRQSNRLVTEMACRHCHSDIVDEIDALHTPDKDMSCIRCHNSVGHLEF